MNLTVSDHNLVQQTLELIKKRHGEYSTVAAGLITSSGKVFYGVNIEQVHSSPCSMCAEYGAIAAMQTDADHIIETVVAITADEKILPPCGRCREMMRQFGNPFVLLKRNEEFFKIRLDELIPYWKVEEHK